MHGHHLTGIVAAAVALVALAPVSAVAADHRIPLGNTPSDIPAEDCGFPIHVDVVQDREYIVKTRDNPDGSSSLRVTGKLILRFTKTDSGDSIVRNVGGPGSVTFSDDGAVFESEGRSVGFYSPAEQATAGVPGLQFVNGHSTVVTDANLAATSVTIRGRSEDGCALLG